MSGLIGLDWGTSSLRAYWLDGRGKIREARSRPWGVRHLPDGGFEAALADITAAWPALPRLAAGMIGSRNGWLEVPYTNLPASTEKLSDDVRTLRLADGTDIHIVPGLRNPCGPDVMRGEETQILGALALKPALAARSTWILPGTHSKWVSITNGVVTDFCTFMTGELFALLRQHSILGAGTSDDTPDSDAFLQGVDAARDSGDAGALGRLFSARALMLDGQLSPASVPSYLSGLLLGEEFRAGIAAKRFDLTAPLQLIGDAGLCERYRQAASHFDIELSEPFIESSAHGLWLIACRMGLVTMDASSAPKESTSC
ncbi:2-dehydro-3-deoxygalactonokinase [Dyella sp. 20L07]|uniref:2-dehydro-3-deoxygalactonokinase n=1 Tax=Dyella sp. 20L07 TaxID=3384240 RepID=UPI003D2A1A6A